MYKIPKLPITKTSSFSLTPKRNINNYASWRPQALPTPFKMNTSLIVEPLFKSNMKSIFYKNAVMVRILWEIQCELEEFRKKFRTW